LAFRNLTLDPSAPVSEWPTEAAQTALERGDLADWCRLAAEVRRRPWGRTARQIEEALSCSRPYGVAEVMETVIARARERAERSERGEVAAEIPGVEVRGHDPQPLLRHHPNQVVGERRRAEPALVVEEGDHRSAHGASRTMIPTYDGRRTTGPV
jgi:hypothetical protein